MRTLSTISLATLIAASYLGSMHFADDPANGTPQAGDATPPAPPAPVTEPENGGPAAPTIPATESNAAFLPVTDETKVDAIAKALGASRKAYATPEEALAVLTKAAGETSNFYGLPIAIRGFNSETNQIDDSAYAGLQAILSYVQTRVDTGKGTKVTGIKGITITAAPNVDAFLTTPEGKAWVEKQIAKECGLVAFRGVRNAATLIEFTNGIDKAPGTVAEYIAEYNRTSDDSNETFNALWAGVRSGIKESIPGLYKLLPSKPIAEKCFRSKAFALSNPETAPLESAPNGSVFAKLLDLMISAAANYKNKDGTAHPLDTDGLTQWKATRDTLIFAEREKSAMDFSVLGALNW